MKLAVEITEDSPNDYKLYSNNRFDYFFGIDIVVFNYQVAINTNTK
jgi:hypothetical protein